MSKPQKFTTAWSECVTREGRGFAVAQVEAATGKPYFGGEIPDKKIDAVISALAEKKTTVTARASLDLVHANLNAMSEKYHGRGLRRT
jgi:hypothetical protein